MTEKFEYKGVWFLPEKPEQKIAGILYFVPNETCHLELIGASFPEAEKLIRIPQIIYGVVKTENSVQKVTLVDCYFSGGNGSSYDNIQKIDIIFSNYICSYILIGKHLSGKEDKVFNRIEVSFPYLNDWYPQSNIEYSRDKKSVSVVIDRNKSTQKQYKINEELDLQLGSSSGYNFPKDNYYLYSNAYIGLTKSHKTDFLDLLKTIGWFKDFYSMAALTTMPFSKVLLYDDDDYYEIETGCLTGKRNKERYCKPTALFYFTKEKFENTGKHSHSFLFEFQDVENEFEIILRKWYEAKDNSELIIQNLISVITFQRAITNNNFLSVVQAIEGYYNRFEKDEISLTDILKNLYEKFKDIHLIVANKIDIKKVVDSRHYYSHILPEGKKGNVCKGFELYELSEKLKPLLVCCILSLIGFDNNKINDLFTKYYYWNGSKFITKIEI